MSKVTIERLPSCALQITVIVHSLAVGWLWIAGMESVRRDIVPLVQDLIFNCLAVSSRCLCSCCLGC